MIVTSVPGPASDANDAVLDFVRFCHRRRRTGWPELYDEMCAVARRGIYRGWSFAELAEHGITFGLAEMPRLAALVAEVASQERARRPVPEAAPLHSVPRDEPFEASAWELPEAAAAG